jgi:hypothetical protein
MEFYATLKEKVPPPPSSKWLATIFYAVFCNVQVDEDIFLQSVIPSYNPSSSFSSYLNILYYIDNPSLSFSLNCIYINLLGVVFFCPYSSHGRLIGTFPTPIPWTNIVFQLLRNQIISASTPSRFFFKYFS